MPTPPYPATSVTAIVKKIVITVNPNETVNFVPNGANGFFSTSQGFWFTETTDVMKVTPKNMFSYYDFNVYPGDKKPYYNLPNSFVADHFELKNIGTTTTTITVYQLGF